jgi:uncharacterized lipoprotein YmbA
MMIDLVSRRQLLLVGVAGGALAGCTASTPPRLYTLASRPGPVLAHGPATTAVRDAALAKYLDRPQIVRRGGIYQLEAAEFDRWGEPLSDMVTRVLIEDLSQRLPASQFFRDASPTATDAQATLEIDISQFDADPDDTVVLAARWALRLGDQPGPAQSARLTAKPASKSTADLVAAMSQALGQLADRIAASLAS